MDSKTIIALADYMGWVNHKIIFWLRNIDDLQWKEHLTSSFESIQDTVLHIVATEKIWIDFWKNKVKPEFLQLAFKGSKNELIEIWEQSSIDLKNFIDNFPETQYTQPISNAGSYSNINMEFQQTFLHFIIHASYHRGQLVTMLRQVGFAEVSSTDLGAYYKETNT